MGVGDEVCMGVGVGVEGVKDGKSEGGGVCMGFGGGWSNGGVGGGAAAVVYSR